ncbi:unnamed protein product, partial [Prorocentrum cordatum]
ICMRSSGQLPIQHLRWILALDSGTLLGFGHLLRAGLLRVSQTSLADLVTVLPLTVLAKGSLSIPMLLTMETLPSVKLAFWALLGCGALPCKGLLLDFGPLLDIAHLLCTSLLLLSGASLEDLMTMTLALQVLTKGSVSTLLMVVLLPCVKIAVALSPLVANDGWLARTMYFTIVLRPFAMPAMTISPPVVTALGVVLAMLRLELHVS